ncbi:MAG: DUF72 domain-containing protein [Gemmatimonadota bacterium]
MMQRTRPIRVGVAGWDYDDWKGVVYPRPRPRGFDPVRHLAAYIDLIEINSTFYRPVRAEVARRWVERVSGLPGFRYSAKLWRRFTHERETAWTRGEAERVKAGFAPLLDADRLDAVLVQFPWSFKNDEASREWLSDVATGFRGLPLVVEVRHASWNEPGFYGWLADVGVGFVNIDQPLFDRSIGPASRSTARTGYVRIHGRNYRDWWRVGKGDARYDYLYSPDELRPWAERVRRLARARSTGIVNVVFNNHARGKAVVNALQLRTMLEGRPAAAPPTLFDAYRDALEGYARPMASDEAGRRRRRAA